MDILGSSETLILSLGCYGKGQGPPRGAAALPRATQDVAILSILAHPAPVATTPSPPSWLLRVALL